jgi:hypothetical protein
MTRKERDDYYKSSGGFIPDVLLNGPRWRTFRAVAAEAIAIHAAIYPPETQSKIYALGPTLEILGAVALNPAEYWQAIVIEKAGTVHTVSLGGQLHPLTSPQSVNVLDTVNVRLPRTLANIE